LLAHEAPVAVCAAEAASKPALDAHDGMQCALAELEGASSAEPARGSKAVTNHLPEWQPALPVAPAPQNLAGPIPGAEGLSFGARSEPEHSTPQPKTAPASVRTRKKRPPAAKSRARARHEPASPAPAAQDAGNVHVVEAAQPIYANLIQFPREMVATRKIRPRRAEGPLAAVAPEAQLSIFEVDPRTISTEPAAAVEQPAAPVWMRTGLSSVELEPQLEEELVEEPALQSPAPAPLELAPLNRRLLALVVDLSLIVAAVLAVAMLMAANARVLPGPRGTELAAALVALAIGAAYQTLFLTLARATPGMRYAGIGLSTFEGDSPTRAQRCGRLMALPLSVLPLGLGLVWALLDDCSLTWHDRLSQTYLRKL
jgi:uncharacterized RDD family membrane protein YckC